MSEIITMKVFEVVQANVTVDLFSQTQLIDLQNKLMQCIQAKIKKLELFWNTLKTASIHGLIVVHDEYRIHRDLKEIMESFGMEVKEVDLGLTGTTYLVRDELISTLREIPSTNDIELVSQTLALNPTQQKLVERYTVTKDAYLGELLTQIRDHGIVSTNVDVVREKTTAWRDNTRLSETYKEIRNDSTMVKQQIENTLSNYLENSNHAINQYNTNMVTGTKQIIVSRARSMGYGVKEVKKGSTTQLVLVKLGR